MSSTLENSKERSMLDKDDFNSQYVWGELARFISGGFSSPLNMSGEEPENLRKLMVKAPPEWVPAIQKFADLWKTALNDKEALSLAYARLFLGPFEILAPPYASFYLEPDHKVMGATSFWVAERYVEAGLKPGDGPKEIPDHVALEWEFLYYLTYQYLTSRESNWLEMRENFIRVHMRRWIPMLSKEIKKAETHPFYSYCAELMVDLIKRRAV